MTVIEITEMTPKVERGILIAQLRKRDGNKCMLPGCKETLDFSLEDGPNSVTIDHWIPQWIIREVAEGDPDPWETGKIPEWIGKREDWNYERIWSLPNLKLMHKKCNAKKGDRIPFEDGTLPERAVRKFRYRRDKRADRAEVCVQCDNGHNLLPDEVCAACGRDPQEYPRWLKVRYQDCDHAIKWCWSCSIGVTPREVSIATAMRQADSDELGEWFDPESEEVDEYLENTSRE